MKTISLGLFALIVAGCNPYDTWGHGEFNAGPVDPASFPAAYLGFKSTTQGPYGRNRGAGKFVEVAAYISGNRKGYYAFPFTNAQLALADKLRIKDIDPAKVPPVANAYDFDPVFPNPIPPSQQCQTPPNYVYDPIREDMRLDEQDNIFTRLPSEGTEFIPGVDSVWTYVPVVSEVPVTASGLNCQSIKSEKKLLNAFASPPVSGRVLNWAIIDAAAPVYRWYENSSSTVGGAPGPSYGVPDGGYVTGVGVQRYGWFGHYYLAYIEGGYIPTSPDRVTEIYHNRMETRDVVRMNTQKIFVPRMIRSGTTNAPGQITAGYDVLEYPRGDPNYSPVCEVWLYTATTGPNPRPIADLPKSKEEIDALGAAGMVRQASLTVAADIAPDAPSSSTQLGQKVTYLFCSQVD
jgi:hypothetical protein